MGFSFVYRGTHIAQAVRQRYARGHLSAMSYAALFNLPWRVRLNALTYGCIYGAIFPFENTGVELLVELFGSDAVSAGYTLSVSKLDLTPS